jgi:hypothetical protein
MNIAKPLLAMTGAVVAGLVALSAPAVGADNFTCNGVAPANVGHNLLVQANASCIIPFGSTVGHDVVVKPGGSLDDRGATIGHDIVANKPKAIHVNGGGLLGRGSIGHDILIDGVTGGGLGTSGLNSVCNNDVGNDVIIEHSASTAAAWSIGARHGVCGAGALGIHNDLIISNNANKVVVADNTPGLNGQIGHNLLMSHNSGGLIARNNHAGHDCHQIDNHPYSIGHGPPNTAGHNIDACNTPNP